MFFRAHGIHNTVLETLFLFEKMFTYDNKLIGNFSNYQKEREILYGNIIL